MVATQGSTRKSAVRVLGVGSPHGDDQVAWKVVEHFRRKPIPGVDAIAVREPVRVLDHLEGCQRLVIVDATQSEAEPGTIIRPVWPAPEMHERSSRSTHGFGVDAVLKLADRLGWLPPSVVLIGIEIAACHPGTEVSPQVNGALPKLYETVLAEVRPKAKAATKRNRKGRKSP
jgi:hydrogenase maturation protease